MEGTLLAPGGQHSGHRHRTNVSAREATFSKPSLCSQGQRGLPWFRRKDVSCLHLPSSSCALVVVWAGDTQTGEIPARSAIKSKA